MKFFKIIGFVFIAGFILIISTNNSDKNKINSSSQLNNKIATSKPLKHYSEATFPQYTYEELVEKAEVIIEGHPKEVVKSYMEQGDIPFTLYNFKVNKVYKGNDIEKEILLLQDGNEQDEFMDHPLMKLNKNVILFLVKSKSGDLIMLGGPSGKFEFNGDENLYLSKTGMKIDESLKLIN